MTKQLIHSFSLILLATATSYASDSGIVAQIPFAFHVGDSLLLAGNYTVDTQKVPGALQLKSADAKSLVTIFYQSVQSVTAPSQNKLIFTKYGDEYFLFQVWVANSDRGHELRRSRRERELGMRAQLKSLIAGQ